MPDPFAAMVLAARAGDRAAAEQLFAALQPLVMGAARRYRDVALEDARQEAWLALWLAVREFEPANGVPFLAYATAKVRGDVRTAMRRLWRYDDRVVHVSGRGEDAEAEQAEEALSRLAAGRAQADGRMAAGAGGCGPESLDPMAAADWRLTVRAAGLSDRERLWLAAAAAGYGPMELAAACGVSAETVRTWRKRTLYKLRAALAEAW
ncbi:hypothetical protein GCM10010885_23800 [Alicyclobacillus cellulosilyticus]|uniref:RNA polymerase sigma factor SigS n=1 Tax=Alicyclobacillus cellulosilyticus TaxID=1003997 RepID=A0A917NNC2_9BACL|nr:hypothetical protein GCM10010885_23800 [Alicyclobacillus cellulosilyticus]